ncbi:MAG TPA: HDOD domain-containing protein [Rhodocyclaceae bacterium]|nr:HDOD domain-containing protein [Rhodocyclaceae bacterium]
MDTSPLIDKKGPALSAQRFRMLEDIARELQGEIVFPICFDVAIRLREMIDDETKPLEQIVRLVMLDPLISARLLRMANAPTARAGRDEIRDVRSAIARLGLKTVRTTAMAIAIKQLLRSRDMVDFTELAHNLWVHSILTASAACIVARELTRFNPDEAMFAGLVHDLGAFYMLYRAAQYPELRARPDTVKHLVAQWHESIGVSLLEAISVPPAIVDAVRDHDVLRTLPASPRTLNDVVYISNLLAGGGFEYLHQDVDPAALRAHEPPERFQALLPAIQEHSRELRAVLEPTG